MDSYLWYNMGNILRRPEKKKKCIVSTIQTNATRCVVSTYSTKNSHRLWIGPMWTLLGSDAASPRLR